MTQEDERLTPAWQWTKTPPADIPSLIKEIAAGKCRIKLEEEASATFIIL